jgi:hypothetical protein
MSLVCSSCHFDNPHTPNSTYEFDFYYENGNCFETMVFLVQQNVTQSNAKKAPKTSKFHMKSQCTK